MFTEVTLDIAEGVALVGMGLHVLLAVPPCLAVVLVEEATGEGIGVVVLYLDVMYIEVCIHDGEHGVVNAETADTVHLCHITHLLLVEDVLETLAETVLHTDITRHIFSRKSPVAME